MKKQVLAAALAFTFAVPAVALACDGMPHDQTAQVEQSVMPTVKEVSVDQLVALKKESKTVFYCANSKCGASHQAAERAIQAGFTDVSVLPVGLMGWKSSGQPTVNVKPQS